MRASSGRRLACRSAFTLIEMLVVVVVLALISAIVAVRWSSVHHRAVHQSLLDRLELADQHLRRFSRSRGEVCELGLDSERNRFRKTYTSAENSTPAWESLGTGVRLNSIRIGQESPERRVSAVPFNVAGQSPTYGLHLSGPGAREIWLLFSGVSGQMTVLPSEAAWNEAFRLLEPPSL